MRITALIVLAYAIVLAAPSPDQETITLPCIADTNLSSYEHEARFNYGRSTHLRLKGIQMMALFRFDTDRVRRARVLSAELRLRYAGSDRMLRTVGVSTITVPWEEGDGVGEEKPGRACFAQRRLGQVAWAPDATDFAEIIFRQPGLWTYKYVSSGGDAPDWLRIEVPPEIVEAMAAGLATGIVVTDEKGQTAANNDVFSREQTASSPSLVVRISPRPSSRPSPPSSVCVQPVQTEWLAGRCALDVFMNVPADAVGVRWRVVSPRSSGLEGVLALGAHGPFRGRVSGLPSGERLTLSFTSVGPDGTESQPVNVECVTPAQPTLPEPLRLRAGSLSKTPVWELDGVRITASGELQRSDPFRAGVTPHRTGLWDGRRIRLQTPIGGTAGFLLAMQNLSRETTRVGVSSSDARVLRLWRVLPVPTSRGSVPEICLPLEDPVVLEAGSAAWVLVEVGLAGGLHTASSALSVSVQPVGHQALKLPVSVEPLPVAIPERPRFEISLNTYGSPARACSVDPAGNEGIAIEHAFHRFAWEHRATLAPLGYSHSGNLEPAYAPVTEGEGATRRVAEWSAWDARFGALLDGTAFRGTSRRPSPISHLYLPFHEAWPEDVRKHYSYTPSTSDYPQIIIEHAMRAGPIESMLSSAYAEGIERTLRAFQDHLRSKGWTGTAYHFYLNNKYYYRDPALGGRGTSWWLLDEPMHRDDWLALAWFARRLKQMHDEQRTRLILFRADVSRPQWQRDYLDGLVDLMVVNDELFHRPALMQRYRDRGVRLWHYGEAPPVDADPSECVLWPVRAYLAGAEGIVPWQSIGTRNAYTRPEATALIVPSPQGMPPMPLATLRLKALRRGQEDVELLRLLAERRKWTRRQLAAAIQPYLERRDVETLRMAVLQAITEPAQPKTARNHASQRPGQAAAGRPRSPRPKP